jgi:hypothetical protein
MEKEKLESLLIDYIEGHVNEQQRKQAEELIASSQDIALLYEQLKEVMVTMDQVKEAEPSASLKLKFEEALQKEIGKTEGKQVFFQPWLLRAAAGIGFLVVGIAIGYWINENNQQKAEMAKLKEQVEENKRMMMAMLDNQQSASQRLMGATVAYELKQADDDIVKALVKTMNEDPNSNVRLAALDALGKFYKQTHVRNALVTSLSSQKDPVVQIALIRLLVQMKEKEVVNELEQITRDGHVIKAVKDEAYAGILKLS